MAVRDVRRKWMRLCAYPVTPIAEVICNVSLTVTQLPLHPSISLLISPSLEEPYAYLRSTPTHRLRDRQRPHAGRLRGPDVATLIKDDLGADLESPVTPLSLVCSDI